MLQLVATKPEGMPDHIWQGLQMFVANQKDRGYRTSIKRVWRSDGKKKYWRCTLNRNNVTSNFFYSPTKPGWRRSD